MALARMAFDLLRNPAVKSALQARIHKKLNELRMPTYIHGFEVWLILNSCFGQGQMLQFLVGKCIHQR